MIEETESKANIIRVTESVASPNIRSVTIKVEALQC